MNCQRIEGVITDLARDQMVEAGTRDEALKHCEVCASCARTLADQRALTVALRSLAKSLQCVDAPRMIQQNLAAGLSTQTMKPTAAVSNHRRQYWAAAVAAILLIFFAIGAIQWGKQSVESIKSEGNLAGARPTETPAAPAAFVGPEDRRKQVPQKPKISKKRASSLAARENIRGVETTSLTTAAKYESSEIATEFLPLGYGNALSLQDGGQIVRVEVPRSTLVSFGLPVNLDRVGQRVKADLLLGIDGSARAIRFVQ